MKYGCRSIYTRNQPAKSASADQPSIRGTKVLRAFSRYDRNIQGVAAIPTSDRKL